MLWQRVLSIKYALFARVHTTFQKLSRTLSQSVSIVLFVLGHVHPSAIFVTVLRGREHEQLHLVRVELALVCTFEFRVRLVSVSQWKHHGKCLQSALLLFPGFQVGKLELMFFFSSRNCSPRKKSILFSNLISIVIYVNWYPKSSRPRIKEVKSRSF